MKFSTSILSAVLALSACSSTYAFSAQRSILSLVKNNSVRSSPLASTVENTKGIASADTIATNAAVNGLNDTACQPLSPEFQAARDAVVQKFTTALPDPALEKPLVHFMEEYFAVLDTASKSGMKNPEGSDITAQQAMKMMGETLQYGGWLLFRSQWWRSNKLSRL